jgi:hypothetical protein
MQAAEYSPIFFSSQKCMTGTSTPAGEGALSYPSTNLDGTWPVQILDHNNNARVKETDDCVPTPDIHRESGTV